MRREIFLLATIILAVGVIMWAQSGSVEGPKNWKNANLPVVAFGDSLTAGYGAGKENSYPTLLAQKISRPVVNLGLSGDTAANAPARLPAVLQERPYMVLIEFGGNDFMRSVSFADTMAAMEKIVDSVQNAGAVAVIVDTGGFPGMSRYSKAYKELAKRKGALFVPGILDGVFGNPKLKADQIHPNAEGYKVVADKVHKAIKKYL